MEDGSLDKYDVHQRSAMGGEGYGSAGSLMNSLPQMMYGYGDVESPLPETVACMEQLVSEYVRYVTDEACKAAEVKGRLDTECYVFAVRGDRPKFKRARELQELSVHIKASTRQRFTDQDMGVFHPTFLPTPKVRAVASVQCLSVEDTDPPLGPSPSPSPPPSTPGTSLMPPPPPESPRVASSGPPPATSQPSLAAGSGGAGAGR